MQLQLQLNIEKVEVSCGFKYNSNERNDDVCISVNGVMTKSFNGLDLDKEVWGEIMNQPNEENHFMVSLAAMNANFIGYVKLSKSFVNETERTASFYIRPSDFMMRVLLNGANKKFTLVLSGNTKFSEATAFSEPRDKGKLLQFELEGETIIPVYSAKIEYEPS
tara:strand:+ start:1146 stop:1637 length:492 start_codon:yes stop_codon:yes gene_type:complete